MSTDGQCPCCHPTESQVWLTSATGLAFLDGYPVAEAEWLQPVDALAQKFAKGRAP